jgi:hypothetical protein
MSGYVRFSKCIQVFDDGIYTDLSAYINGKSRRTAKKTLKEVQFSKTDPRKGFKLNYIWEA